jgi:hypothetical protein
MLLLAAPAQALTWHVCDCAQGADSDCIAGNDAAAGTLQAPLRSLQSARGRFLLMAAGDEIRFCAGGRTLLSSSVGGWFNPACSANQPCLIGAYVPPWASGDEPVPVIETNAGVSALEFADGGVANRDGGYRVEDLQLIGSGGGSFGVFFYNDVDDVEVARLEISGFDVGVHLAGSNPCDPADASCDGRNERITVRDSYIHDNHDQGVLGGGNDFHLLYNLILRNGTRRNFDHNVYLSGSVRGVRAVGNILAGSALDETGVCQAVSLVVHGVFDDLRIDGNHISEGRGLAGPGCWGIAVSPGYGSSERFDDVVISGNRLEHVGNVAIGVGACRRCVIENNTVVAGQDYGLSAIAAPVCCGGSEDPPIDALTIRNNSIWLQTRNATGITLGAEGAGHRISHNAIEVVDVAGSACFAVAAPAAVLTMDHQRCAGSQVGVPWLAGVGNLANWQVASGFDSHSAELLPGFRQPAIGDFRAADAAAPIVGTGDPQTASATDLHGLPRQPPPDIGAEEWQADALWGDGFE